MIHRYVFLAISTLLLALPPGAAVAETMRGTAAEYAAEQKALVRATAALFDRIEARSAPRKTNSEIGVLRRKTGARRIADGDDTENLTRMGPVAHLTGYRITWYPMERLHGTVDFMGTWNGNRNLVCGYVTWDVTNPNAPRLEAIDASFVDLADFSEASDTQVHRNLIAANCAYGAIEANYRVFDPAG